MNCHSTICLIFFAAIVIFALPAGTFAKEYIVPDPATIMDAEQTSAANQPAGKVVVAGTSVPTEIFAETLDAQRELILRIIATGMSSGQLAPDEAAGLRSELDKIVADEETARRNGGLTYTKSVVIARNLDKLGAAVTRLLPLSPVAPLIAGSHFSLAGNQIIPVDDITFRRGQLEFWISHALATGSISEQSAADLRRQMDEIAGTEARYRADGILSPSESRVLYKSFDTVASNLDRARARDRHKAIGLHMQQAGKSSN